MTNGRNNNNQRQKQDDLLREGRKDDERVNPFEQVSKTTKDDDILKQEAESEQQHKETMTERD